MKILNHLMEMKIVLFLSLVSICLSSCYPDEPLETGDLDVVISFYDEAVNFSDFKTYSMPDSVVFLDKLSNENPDNDFDEAILSKVKSNLEALGYVEESDPENNPADVVVLVSKVLNQNIEAYTYYDWWGYYSWYPYWGAYPYPYGPGWSPYYPWGGTVVYSYESGTLFVEMIDVGGSDESAQEIPTVWSGAINGLLIGSNAEVQARLNENIDQLFEQSPYLKIN